MTMHKIKPTITAERKAWFAAYHHKHGAWGAFHVSLDDANYEFGASAENSRGEEGELEAIAWFNTLTPSQRRRLSRL